MNTHIKTTMYIPLHAAIITEVYRWCQHPRRPLPRTITQLYTCLVNIILRRYLDSHPDYKGKETHLQEITDLPPPVYKDFNSLTQLAYAGVTQQKLIFQDKDQPIHHLGFMDVVTELFSSFDNQQVSYSYNFLHLNIQEYLAAYYVSTMEVHQQEQQLETMCSQTHLQNVTRFLAGITQFKNIDRAIVKKITEGKIKSTEGEEEEEVEKDEEEEEEEKVKTLSTHALQLLYECGDASILNNNQCYVCPLNDHSPLFDFSLLGYCIAHSNCKWKLELGDVARGMKSTEGIKMLVKEITNVNHTDPIRVENIVFRYGAPECVEQLLTGMPQNVLPQLQTLELCCEKHPLPQCVPELTDSMSSLHTLLIYDARGTSAVHRTERTVIRTIILKELTLCDCDIDDECVTTLCQWLSKSSQLETLKITLPSPDVIKMISEALTTNTTLKTLDLWRSKFDLPAMQAVCCMLTHNSTITEMRLRHCEIKDDIVCCLAEGLHSNNTLTNLDLSLNSISDSGAESIAQKLHSNNTLTTLNIRGNSISNSGAVYMAKMLKINNTLQEVDLSYNKIGSEGQMALHEANNTNKHIKLEYWLQNHAELDNLHVES